MPQCPSDVNGSGLVDVGDPVAYLRMFERAAAPAGGGSTSENTRTQPENKAVSVLSSARGGRRRARIGRVFSCAASGRAAGC